MSPRWAACLLAIACSSRAHKPDGRPPAQSAVLNDYKLQLSEAGDHGQCNVAVARVGEAMAKDQRIADADLRAEIDHFERVKGDMPYPSPGTACSLFGFQTAAHDALARRRH